MESETNDNTANPSQPSGVLSRVPSRVPRRIQAKIEPGAPV